MIVRLFFMLIALSSFTAAVAQEQILRMTDAELERAREMAASVTIYRDTFGVAHVYGPTDASAVFGFTWARAEDEFASRSSRFSGCRLPLDAAKGRSTSLSGFGGVR